MYEHECSQAGQGCEHQIWGIVKGHPHQEK